MKKIWLLTLLMPMVSWAGWFGPGVPDYSQDASSIYICASTGPIITQAGISVSSPTLSLYNPINSGKNLVVLNISNEFALSPAAASQIVLAFNLTPSSGTQANTGVTPYTTSGLVGTSTMTATSAGIGVCRMEGILPATPTPFRLLGGSVGASSIDTVLLSDQTMGQVVVPPGGLISIQTSTAASLQSSIEWREDPQ